MEESLAKRIRLLQSVAAGGALLSLALVAVGAATWGHTRWTSWALPLLILGNLGMSRGRPRLAWGLSGVSIAVAGAIIYASFIQ